jgi:hypothetical protein
MNKSDPFTPSAVIRVFDELFRYFRLVEKFLNFGLMPTDSPRSSLDWRNRFGPVETKPRIDRMFAPEPQSLSVN